MKVALVTGSSKGIGSEIAIQLAGVGYNVAVTGRDESGLQKVADEIEKQETNALMIKADLLDDNAPGEIVQSVVDKWGKLDVLVNNAGVVFSGSFLDVSPSLWDKVFRINAKAPFFICKEAVPYLKLSKKPVIINISSVVGFKGYTQQSIYVASKHALTGFTKVLAKEVQPYGIRVHLISPGGVNTEMVSKVRPDINTEELIGAEEIAELVGFIVSRKGKGTIDHLYIRRNSGLAFD